MPGEREPDLGLDRRIETRCTKDLTLVFDQQASLSQLSDRGKVFPVCGNTWCMLADTRFAPHFDFVGNFATHYGIFPGCGTSIPFATNSAPAAKSSGGCC